MRVIVPDGRQATVITTRWSCIAVRIDGCSKLRWFGSSELRPVEDAPVLCPMCHQPAPVICTGVESEHEKMGEPK